MLYLLYGKETYLIESFIKDIIAKHNIDAINIIKYNLDSEKDSEKISDVLDDCQTLSLFNDQKIIIANNLLANLTKEEELSLNQYINNSNKNTILIITEIKLDERKKIVKTLKSKTICKEFNKTNVPLFVKEKFENKNISNEVIDFFITRVGNDLNLLANEILKIKTYKGDETTITSEDIIALTTKNITLDIFKLIDYIITKNKSEAICLYNELLKNGGEPIAMIVMLANQFRIIYQAKILIKKGYSLSDIAHIINIHPYRIKLALQNSSKYNEQTILYFLYSLANLDLDIKMGKRDKNIALELFILST
ncbi:MAG: DNA polymerase III subunit delta [Bacilli bacterium]